MSANYSIFARAAREDTGALGVTNYTARRSKPRRLWCFLVFRYFGHSPTVFYRHRLLLWRLRQRRASLGQLQGSRNEQPHAAVYSLGV